MLYVKRQLAMMVVEFWFNDQVNVVLTVFNQIAFLPLLRVINNHRHIIRLLRHKINPDHLE